MQGSNNNIIHTATHDGLSEMYSQLITIDLLNDLTAMDKYWNKEECFDKLNIKDFEEMSVSGDDK